MPRVTTGRPGRSWSVAVAVTAVTAVTGVLLLASGAPAHADPVPYTDERSSGLLTLCDAGGHELRAGSVVTQPFVHLVVAQTPAPAGYDDGRGTASLYGYQPRQGLAPGQWSGELMTGASRFADPHRPAAVALPEDLSLGGFAADFPPTWHGLVQLRLYVGAPGRPLQSQRYDSADVQISGDHWSLVRGGGGSCRGVKAVAVARLLGVQSTAVPTQGATVRPGAAPPPSSGGADGSTSSTGTSVAARAASGSSRGSGPQALSVALVVLVLLLGGGALLLRRRRSPHPA